MLRNCGQNSQQILNWFAGKKQTTKRRREKYECKKSCSRPHTHTHTHTYTYANGFTAPLCCCCWSLLFFPHFSSLVFFFASFGYATVYWYYYGTMLCNICKFLLLLPTTVFPEFPQLAPPPPLSKPLLLPCTALSHSHSVDICWHHSAHCCRWCFFVLFAFCSGSLLLLYFYYIICSIWIYENRAKKKEEENKQWEKQTEIWKLPSLSHVGQVQIYAVSPNKFGNKFKIKVSSCSGSPGSSCCCWWCLVVHFFCLVLFTLLLLLFVYCWFCAAVNRD